MAIKKYYVNSPKPGYLLDRKANKYFSWGIDIWLNGTRMQERGFASKEKAANAVSPLKDGPEKSGRRNSKGQSRIYRAISKETGSMSPADRARAKRVFTYFLALIPEAQVSDAARAHKALREAGQRHERDGPR